MFKFTGKGKIPEAVCLVLWDVDGTITDVDKPDELLLKIIRETGCNKGVKHAFVTGRDWHWLQKLRKLIKTINPKNSEKGMANLYFYPELGLIKIGPNGEEEISEEMKDHLLLKEGFRRRLAGLFLRTSDAESISSDGEVPFSEGEVFRDANGNLWRFPFFCREVLLPDFIWSEQKEVIATAEVIRGQRGEIVPQRREKIELAAEVVRHLLAYWGVDKELAVVSTPTAFSVIPKVGHLPLDKGWCAGLVLQQIAAEVGLDVETIAQRAIAIGDGKSDFNFSFPRFSPPIRNIRIPFVFVGPKSSYNKDLDQETIIRPRGEEFGPLVARAVMEAFEEKFRSF